MIKKDVTVSNYESVKQAIYEHLPTDTDKIVEMKSHLKNDINLGSLEIVGVVMRLEAMYDISITDREAGKFQTVKDIVDYLNILFPHAE